MKTLFRVFLLTAFLLLGGVSLNNTYAQDTVNQRVSISVLTDKDAVVPGQGFTVAITQDIEDGWHTYWLNPGDSGLKSEYNWTLPNGVKTGDEFWPAPQRFPYDGLVNFGYENSVTTLQKIFVPTDFSGDIFEATLEANWLVCKDICLPENGSLTVSLPVSDTSSRVHDDFFNTASNALPKDSGIKASYSQNNQDIIFTLETEIAAQNISELIFFPYEWGVIENTTSQDLTLTDTGASLTIAKAKNSPINGTVKGVITLTTLDNQTHSYEISALPTKQSPTKSDDADSLNTEPQNTQTSDISILNAILFAFVGGLILNLMPCVFPVLSMKALSLVKTREKGHAGEVRLHGLLYTLGVVLSFVAIAGLLIILKQSNDALAWGFQLQEPLFIGLLAYLFFAIGLNLTGFFEIGAGGFMNMGSKLTSSNGKSGSFFTGVLAVLVATPCTAPFMASALGFAFTQSTGVALMVFVSLGLGLAFPYLALCFAPGLQKFLPKPGAWMDSFKQFLSFPIFITVAWLVWVYGQQTSISGIFYLLLGLIGLAMLIWTHQRKPISRIGKFIKEVFATLVFLLTISVFAADFFLAGIATYTETEQKISSSERVYSTEALARELQGDNPVFVEMTAAWCITCQLNKRVAIKTDKTQQLLRDKNVTYFLGDWTNQDPEITKYLAQFGRSGVPLYVYYGAPDETGTRPNPYILPQLLTEGIVKGVLDHD